MPSKVDFKEKLAAFQREIEDGVHNLLPASDTRPTRIHQAMRYSMAAGGKRLRPVLTLAVAELGRARARALPAAIAIECVHTYSLIHDDLPAMDDDDLRRGRPTCHRKFDEATAILAGDALLTHAFALLAEHFGDAPGLASALVRELADAAGSRRLIGGQMEDIQAEKRTGVTAGELAFIHRNKTGAMIEAALVIGGLCAGFDAGELDTLRAAGGDLGVAFQIVDDILDATSDSKTLGKTAGKDAREGKATYVSLHGLKNSRQQACDHTEPALAAFAKLPGDPTFLMALTRHLLEREK
ncbi:MAG: polyprenyl synthetase family protein [Opitutaceae bacterium]